MRSLLLLTILFSGVTFAKDRDKRDIFLKQAFSLIKDGNYDGARAVLESRFIFENVNKNPTLYYKLVSITYKKLGFYKKAHQSLYFIILKEHREEYKKVLTNVKKGQKTKISEPLLKVHHAQLTLLVLDYKTSPTPKLLRQINFLSKLIKSQDYRLGSVNEMISSLSDFDQKEDVADVEMDLESVDEVSKVPTQDKGKWNFFIGVQELSWQERVTVARPGLAEEGLIVSGQGTCLGAGAEKWDRHGAWSLGGCFTPGVATVDNDPKATTDSSFTYTQSGVPMNTALLSAGYMFRLKAKQSLIGIHVPVIYRSGDFDDTVSGDVVNEKVLIDAGLMLGYRYFIEDAFVDNQHFSVDFKLGRFMQNSSLFWTVGVLYHFEFSKL